MQIINFFFLNSHMDSTFNQWNLKVPSEYVFFCGMPCEYV